MKRKQTTWYYIRHITADVYRHPANADHRLRALLRMARWQVRKRVRSTPVDVDFEGLVLRCHPGSDSASNVFYFTSRYDWDEMAFLERYLRPGDGFLDIGANIGTYSLFAASVIGTDAHIEAFEPLPLAAERARANFERNHLTDAIVHEVAVDDHAGEAAFVDFDVSSSIHYDTVRPARASLTVPVERIDALATGSGYAFAKLDVEGVELRALQGAQRLIDRHDPPVWLVEIMDHQLEKYGATPDLLVAWMAGHGFVPSWYDAATATLSFDPAVWHGRPNYLFVAEDHRDAVLERISRPAASPARDSGA